MRFKSYFVIIPEKHQVETETLSSQARHYGLTLQELDRELPEKMIEDFFKERNIAYIDTLPCLINRKGLYYRFDDHLTAAGHAAVAACIDQTVNDEILSIYAKQ
jgi:hypothetical protein